MSNHNDAKDATPASIEFRCEVARGSMIGTVGPCVKITMNGLTFEQQHLIENQHRGAPEEKAKDKFLLSDNLHWQSGHYLSYVPVDQLENVQFILDKLAKSGATFCHPPVSEDKRPVPATVDELQQLVKHVGNKVSETYISVHAQESVKIR